MTTPAPSSADRIAAHITSQLHGKPPGTPVPTDTDLAAELGVSPATANKAKQALAARGIISKTPTGKRYLTT